jgi:hypothetical protein
LLGHRSLTRAPLHVAQEERRAPIHAGEDEVADDWLSVEIAEPHRTPVGPEQHAARMCSTGGRGGDEKTRG